MAASEPLCPLRITRDGWAVMTVKYTLVPGFDYEATVAGMSREDIERELEISWTAVSGVKVYPQFNADIHVAKRVIRYDPREPLYLGVDPGLTPSFVVSQLNSYGQWLILSAIAPEQGSGLGTYEFGQMCADHLTREYALPHGKDLKQIRTIFFGDPAGNSPPVRTGTTNVERDVQSHWAILRDGIHVPAGVDDRGETIWEHRQGWGWHIIAGEMHLPARLEALRARLSLLINGQAAFVVSPDCKEVIQALSSYHYKVRADGRQELDPFKDWASHTCNAIEYVCSKLWHQADEEDDEDARPRRKWRSIAAGPERDY